MLQAAQFVEAARTLGFDFYAGVPCSFLTPFINYVIDDPGLTYLSAANEGDAVAAVAGGWIGGRKGVAMMQNSGLGNAVSPLTSLTHVFRIPMLLICTHRGAPGVADEPQHELMGQITEQMFDTMGIPWEIFPRTAEEIGPALARACRYMDVERRPYAFIMHKGTVAPHELKIQDMPVPRAAQDITETARNPDSTLLSRESTLRRLVQETPEKDCVLLASTGFAGRELYAIADRPNHLYMVGSMGCISSLGLGLAMHRPDLRVVVIDGDGAALMRMGNLATVGTYGGDNLLHLLLDNGAHDSTGAQSTVAGNVDFASIARACGYAHVARGADENALSAFLAHTGHGPGFLHLKIRTGTIPDLPRPKVTPVEVLDRLMRHCGRGT